MKLLCKLQIAIVKCSLVKVEEPLGQIRVIIGESRRVAAAAVTIDAPKLAGRRLKEILLNEIDRFFRSPPALCSLGLVNVL